jgi:hypothetical protein
MQLPLAFVSDEDHVPAMVDAMQRASFSTTTSNNK